MASVPQIQIKAFKMFKDCLQKICSKTFVSFIESSHEVIKLLRHASLMENYTVSQSDRQTESQRQSLR